MDALSSPQQAAEQAPDQRTRHLVDQLALERPAELIGDILGQTRIGAPLALEPGLFFGLGSGILRRGDLGLCRRLLSLDRGCRAGRTLGTRLQYLLRALAVDRLLIFAGDRR